jgi:isoquinoline 1-oxidoreductase subunit beta
MSSEPEAGSDIRLSAKHLSRRAVLLHGAGFAITLAFGPGPAGSRSKALTGDRAGSLARPNAWVSIGVDNQVTLISPASEMGQGVMTSIPLLIAEEMDADWNQVKVEQAPSDRAAYGNPGLGGVQATGASLTTRAYYQMLRLVGAQARLILTASAAQLLGVSRGELITAPGVVIHRLSGRQLTFGEIARRGRMPQPIPEATVVDLKRSLEWRYLGKDLPRVDIPAKVNGQAIFGIDIDLPELLHGAVARPPVQGEAPITVEDHAARQIRGFVKTVRLPYGVGVIAEGTWAARKACDALRITWSANSKARAYSSGQVLTEFRKIAASPGGDRVAVAHRGDVSALKGAAQILTATYATEHVHHATMEPPSATALVSAEQVELWGSFQAQSFLQTELAKIIGANVPINVHTTLLGGGFGRKYEADFAIDAVLLARETPGRPVKVTWSREDDVRHGKYRPLVAQFIEVGLDTHGSISAWRHHICADSIMARYAPDLFAKARGVDTPVTEGIDLAYEVPNLLGEYTREARGVDVGFWRGVGPGYTKFAVECMIDEVAGSVRADPLGFRLAHLRNHPRARGVLDAAAQMSGWSKRMDGSPLGIAYSDAYGSHCAIVAEVAIDHSRGLITVPNVWCAIDVGVVMQPRNVEAQIAGGITQGLSHCLHEKIDFVRGEVQQNNFHNYRVLRLSEAPEIQVRILSFPGAAPGGVGEAGVPVIGPAIANAFSAATKGRRLRQYPFSSDRVLTVLKG